MSIEGEKIQQKILAMNEAVQDAKKNLKESGLSEHPTAVSLLKKLDNSIAVRDAGLSSLVVNETLGALEENTEKYEKQKKLLKPCETKL